MRISGNLLTLVVFALGSLAQTPSPQAEKPAPPPVPWRLPITALTPDASINIGGKRAMAVTDEAAWIASREAGSVTRVDLKTNDVAKTISVGKEPCGGILSAFGSLWSPLCGQSAVARVDPKKNEVSVTFPSSLAAEFTAIASAVGSVWLITDNKGTLVRIDPATNATVAEIYLPPGANAMAFGQDALWITSGPRDVLVRLNPFTNLVVETIKVGKGPRSVAIGEGAVWTLNQAGTVSRVDPKTNKVTETIQIGAAAGAAGQIVTGAGSVWVSRAGAPLTRIDPRTNHVVQQFTGADGGVVAFGQQSLWLAATPAAVWRLDPKRIEATRPK
jgi:YVTN family beta-propeller protein